MHAKLRDATNFSVIIFLLLQSQPLISHAQLPNFSAAPESCECPASDELSHPKCGPKPAALAKFNESGKSQPSVACPNCFLGNLGIVPLDPKEVQNQLEASKSLSPASLHTKTAREFNTYLNCNRKLSKTDKGLFCHFKSTLAPLIALTAESAHKPYAVQACLVKAESQFVNIAFSRKKAMGYPQFTPGAVHDANGYINVSMAEYRSTLASRRASLTKLLEDPTKNVFKIRSARKYLRGYYGQYRARLA